MLDRYEKFSVYIAGLYRAVQKIERAEMEKYGLKGAYAQYLVAMRRSEGGLTATQLCEICDKDKAAVSRAVSEMHSKGIIEKEGDGSYRARMRLTEKGQEAADFICNRAEIAVRDAGAGLSAENRTIFYAGLESISKNLQHICKDGLSKK